MSSTTSNFFTTNFSEKKRPLLILGAIAIFALFISLILIIGDARYVKKSAAGAMNGNFTSLSRSNIYSKSSANESVLIATDVYEIPYNFMTDIRIADRLNTKIDVSVYVYREGINSAMSMRGYHFEKWDHSINNMLTENGILYSASLQGYSDNNYLTRFFIKPIPGSDFATSTHKVDFCEFLESLDLVLRKSTITVIGKAGDNSDVSTSLHATGTRPKGNYFTEDKWNFTVFGPSSGNLCA
jgi:hypothetical protein